MKSIHQISLSSAVAVLLLISMQSFGQVGIPSPDFGLKEIAPATPNGWPGTEVPNFYYVDNTSSNATDANNEFGFPDKPRATIPEITFSEGAYVEIHGGPYTGGGQIIFVAEGTKENPVWVRGENASDKPIIRGETIVKGQYVILENLHYDTDRKNIGLRVHNNSHLHHAVVRSCEFEGSGTDVGFSAAVGITGSAGNRFHDIVIYNNEMHHLGDYRPEAEENDYHGVITGRNVDRVWVLNNHNHHLGGDGVQVGTASIPDAERPTHIYVSQNYFHDNHENAVDVKEADDIFITENELAGHTESEVGSEAVVVIHNEPNRVWVVNNEIYGTSVYGVITTSGSDVWLVGNVVYDIHTNDLVNWDPNSGYSTGAAIHFRGSSGGVVNNTLYNYDTGIQLTTNGPYEVSNNLLFGRTQSSGYDLRVANSNVRAMTQSDFNLYGDANIDFGSGDGNTLSAIQDSFSQEMNSWGISEPLLKDVSMYDFRLENEESPLIDKGTVHSVYETYEELYGQSIASDQDGTSRPQGDMWDIGAFEFNVPPVLGISNNTALILYPNPASDHLVVGYPQVVGFSIYDQLGALIQKGQTSQENRIDIRGLYPGIYLVVLEMENRWKTVKFVKN